MTMRLPVATAARTPRPASTPVAVGVIGLAGVGAALSGSPFVVVASGATLVLIIVLFWRVDDVPVLLIPALYQWSEVAVKPIMTAVQGVPIDALADFDAPIETATYFALAGVASLCLGLRFGLGRPAGNALHALRTEAARWPRPAMLKVTLGLIAGGHAFEAAAHAAGPAVQIVLALAGIKLVGLFVLGFWCLSNGRGYGVLAAVAAFEIVIGMTGFFANFREPLLVLFLAAISARPTLRPRDLFVAAFAGSVILGVSVFWSAVKVDYRSYVNAGTGAQIVTQSMSDRLSYLFNAAQGFNGSVFADGADRLVRRLSYVDFLAATLEHVPSNVPHEGGGLIGTAVMHILTPRILFPDKPALPNDSDVTERYTGLPVGGNANTSISIGYLGEFYIDFGVPGALAATFALGGVFGLMYRRLRDWTGGPRLITYGIFAMAVIPLMTFETALIKVVGGMVMTFAAALVLQRLVMPRVLRLAGERQHGS